MCIFSSFLMIAIVCAAVERSLWIALRQGSSDRQSGCGAARTVCLSLMPAMFARSSVARCESKPAPGVAYSIVAGARLAASIGAGRALTPIVFVLTSSTRASRPVSVTGSKSFCGS